MNGKINEGMTDLIMGLNAIVICHTLKENIFEEE